MGCVPPTISKHSYPPKVKNIGMGIKIQSTNMFLFCSSSFPTVLQLKFYLEYNIEEINLTVFNQRGFREINH